METEKAIGWMLKQLHIEMEQYAKELGKDADLTPAQADLIGWLLEQKQQEFFATDLCACLGLSKASVSSNLKELRRKGYLKAETLPGDERKKKLLLQPKAYEVWEEIKNGQKQREDCLCRGISEQERAVMEKNLAVMIQNLREDRRREYVKNTAGAGWGV